MSMKTDIIYPGAPNTERGRSCILSVDPKGKFLLYGSGNNLIMRDLKDPLKVDWYTEHFAEVTAARVSPSGYYVCSGDSQGNVRVWSCTNQDKTLKIEIRPISGAVRDVCWSPDSKRIAIVGDGKSAFSHVFLWDTGSPVGTLSGHSQLLLSVDHKLERPYAIATCGEDGYVNFYKGPPYKNLDNSERDVHKKYVNGIRFKPDGSEFVTVSSDKTIAFFDGKTGKFTGHMDSKGAHTGSIFSVAWSLDGKQIITSSADKTVKFWDSTEKKLITTVTLGDAIEDHQLGVAWPGADLALSVSLSGTINYFDTTDTSKITSPYQSLAGHNTPIYRVIYDAKTNKLYSSASQGFLIEWEFGTSKNRMVKGKQEKGSFTGLTKYSKDQLAVITSEGTIRFVELEGFSYTGDAVKLSAVPNDIVSTSDFETLLVSTRKGVEILIDGKNLKIP
jgi:WD repeat-containing protein 1 (actin-interacting protein 1)